MYIVQCTYCILLSSSYFLRVIWQLYKIGYLHWNSKRRCVVLYMLKRYLFGPKSHSFGPKKGNSFCPKSRLFSRKGTFSASIFLLVIDRGLLIYFSDKFLLPWWEDFAEKLATFWRAIIAKNQLANLLSVCDEQYTPHCREYRWPDQLCRIVYRIPRKKFFLAFITPCDQYHHEFYLVLDEDGLTSYKCKLKGTVSQDFRLQVFFMNQFTPGPWVYHIVTFRIFSKILRDIRSSRCTMVSLAPAANLRSCTVPWEVFVTPLMETRMTQTGVWFRFDCGLGSCTLQRVAPVAPHWG
jgi:hypothetical protein